MREEGCYCLHLKNSDTKRRLGKDVESGEPRFKTVDKRARNMSSTTNLRHPEPELCYTQSMVNPL